MDASGMQRGLSSIWALTAVSLGVLCLRIYCKLSAARKLWADDYVLILSWIFLLVDAAIRSEILVTGVKSPLLLPDVITIGKLNAASGSIAIAATMLSKSSFVLTLLRLITGKMRFVLWFCLASMNLMAALVILFLLIRCKPIDAGWDPTVKGTCWPDSAVVAYGVAASVYSGVMDILLALIPWMILWGLQMKRREKLAVGIAMSMGIFAGITGFVKCVYIQRVSQGDLATAVGIYIWETVETAVTIVVASIPALRVLIKKKKASYGSHGQTGATTGRARTATVDHTSRAGPEAKHTGPNDAWSAKNIIEHASQEAITSPRSSNSRDGESFEMDEIPV